MLELFPFQREGVAFALEREASLIADGMGLGKTAQVVGVINEDASIRRALVVCPASVRIRGNGSSTNGSIAHSPSRWWASIVRSRFPGTESRSLITTVLPGLRTRLEPMIWLCWMSVTTSKLRPREERSRLLKYGPDAELPSPGPHFSAAPSSCIQYCTGLIPKDGPRVDIFGLGCAIARPNTTDSVGTCRELAISRSSPLSCVPRS
jgi:hypothetical protein